LNLYELLNKSLSLIEVGITSDAGIADAKSWFDKNEILYISKHNIEQFNQILEQIYSLNENIYTRFTRQKIYKFIEDAIVKQKKDQSLFDEEISKNFFKTFEEQEPYSKYIIAPISGIRLDRVDKINISIFEIGKQSSLNSFLSNDADGYYIAVKIDNIYDDLIAIEEAKNKFLDFIRLIVFLSGRNDKKILMKTGLPSYPSISHEKMYVESSSYQIAENIEDEFPNGKMDSTYLEKIPIDNDFFCKHENFIKIWELYERKHSNKKISKIETRLLNAAIAIGESAQSKNIKNSIIYTSMAFEILFSFDEGSLFQKSIGDRLADTFAFIVATDKESRLNTIKAVKEFYRLRSALVHGGDTKVNNDYIIFNSLLSAVISELLNNEKYKNVKSIDNLYQMVKEAQNSY
jgi:hypothetical protein